MKTMDQKFSHFFLKVDKLRLFEHFKNRMDIFFPFYFQLFFTDFVSVFTPLPNNILIDSRLAAEQFIQFLVTVTLVGKSNLLLGSFIYEDDMSILGITQHSRLFISVE